MNTTTCFYVKIRSTIKPQVKAAPNPKTSMFPVPSCSCLCPIHWIQVSSREWRCCWSSADRRSSNYIWVINDFIAYLCAAYIIGFTAFHNTKKQHWWIMQSFVELLSWEWDIWKSITWFPFGILWRYDMETFSALLALCVWGQLTGPQRSGFTKCQ